ncbi:MAG TPA: MipA/OmpV family protein [Povalibacter sp.]|nr:MipA/OmpV family protein [Povalibacter sp.]
MISRNCIATAVIALGAALPAHAEEKPLWEAGLGVGALSFPAYRGSDESHLYPVPIPYFVYRGDFFKADRDGVRGRLLDERYAELNISLNATIPVDSSGNDARRGMPDLKPTVELGPSLNLHLWRSTDEQVKFDLVMPLRIPITLEASPQVIGWVFSPRLNLDIENVAGQQGWDFGIGIGPVYADHKFHEYFYSVAPEYATPERPAYDASGGYSGMHVLTALSKRFPTYWVGAYLRYDSLSGAVFDDSPLVRTRHYLAGGFGIAWMIGQSKRMVESDD